MRPPWWLGLATAEAPVDCGGAQHRVEWTAGCLRPVDHADAEAEEALAVLGDSMRARCIALTDAWRRHAQTVQLVTLGRRPGEGPIGYPSDAAPRKLPTRHAIRDAGHRSAVERDLLEGQEVAALLSLPGPLVDRLVLTAMASCVERWDNDVFRAEHGLRVGAALSARAMPALARFGAQLEHRPPLVTVSPSQPDAGPAIIARIPGPGAPLTVTAELPVAWLVDVWGRGISEPDGRLVLGVREADEAGREFLVEVAEWEPAGPITWELAAVPARVVTDDDGRWRVLGA